ncbi:SMI1/KNR4 family protein [Chryseobacterium sp.]|uniref:SMI1/KNR4 family protein n=1 Tax=Chryseobacterium sp. TaxID=1871047 RepID=UPI0025BA98A2|nr:SMI1/KNR4 family protein [Chryseobacterium sp.]MBV8327738.1 SMI1/KNR4 family protein [Chryseobacterium sp.]
MKIKAYQNGDSEKVKQLEKNFKIKLPDDYQKFLVECNGGLVENAYLYIKDLNEYMIMGNFFGIEIEKGFADIVKINDEYDDDIPEKSLLIGSDAGSGFLLLVNDGDNNGIRYYDHTYFFDESSDDLNTYYICGTFTEFLKLLEITKPD